MKKYIEGIKEIYNTPRGKGIAFLLFYFVVFSILLSMLKFNGGNTHKGEYELSKNNLFDYGYLLDDNYHFKYVITIDGKENIYEGDRFEEQELFTYNDKQYYREKDSYYLKEDNWKKVDNPYIYTEFMNVENLEKIIDSSYKEYETSYHSGQNKYGYLTSTNTLNKILHDKDTDIDEKPNTMVIDAGDGVINDIKFQLKSYCLNNQLCKDNLEIKIIYEEYGEIDKIDNPMD